MRDCISRQAVIDLMMQKWGENFSGDDAMQESIDAIREMPSVPQEPTIKALGEELRKARKGIADEKVLIGYNMAIAICNKHLGESEDKE